MPSGATERALYVDVRKALVGESRVGWTVDRVEIEEAAAQVEPSACRVTPAQRETLRKWVEARLSELGGPAEAQYRAGVDIDDLDEVIDFERVLALLNKVEEHLPEDCPFWVEPTDDFEGLHATAHRFVIIAESMGAGSLAISEGKLEVAGGGAARVLPSVGFSARFQLALGVEGGGDAVFEKGDDGSLSPQGAFRFGVPLVLRAVDLDRIYDLELAAVSRFKEGVFSPWGGRIGFAGGVTGLRRLHFMPAIQLWLGYELYPEQRGIPTQHVIRLGTRVGVDLDP